MNVLVVDDSRAMRRIMRKALAFAGVEGDAVREAEHGADALEQVRSDPPSLVLSDINMPVMAGDAFLDAMQEEGFLTETPVVVVTSAAGARTALDLIRRGASRVIRKPFDPLSLHSQLEDLLAPKEATPEAPEEAPAPETASQLASLAPNAPPAPSVSVAPPPMSTAPESTPATIVSCPPPAPVGFDAPTEVPSVRPASASPEPPMSAVPAPPVAPSPAPAGDEDLNLVAAGALAHTLEVSLMESSVVESSAVPRTRMLLTSSIDVRVPFPAEITLLCTYEVATRLAIALVGDDPGDDDGERHDALAELSNMVAGTFVDRAVTGGVRPEHLGLPVRGVVLPGELVGEVWQLARLEEPDGAVYVRMVPLDPEMS